MAAAAAAVVADNESGGLLSQHDDQGDEEASGSWRCWLDWKTTVVGVAANDVDNDAPVCCKDSSFVSKLSPCNHTMKSDDSVD